LRPVGGSELEIAITRPIGHDVNELREVALGIDAVEFAAGDQGAWLQQATSMGGAAPLSTASPRNRAS